jgi:hypothetical protein
MLLESIERNKREKNKLKIMQQIRAHIKDYQNGK